MATNFQRKIGLTTGICFVIGTIIGSGIFISPKGVFINANCSYWTSIFIWILCGIFSMIGSLVYSELGTTIARSGGDYVYISAGFGSFVAFIYLWLNLTVIRPASQAILALTFAYYLLDSLMIDKSSCNESNYEMLARIISALLITLLGYINCVNVKWALHLQNGFTILKILALGAIIVTAICTVSLELLSDKREMVYRIVNDNNDENGKIDDLCVPRYSLSIYSGLFAFGGWNYLNIVTDELKNPYKNLPRAAMVGIFACTIIYVLANASYFVTLNSIEILNSPAIALTFARKLLGPIGVLLITLSISASAVGSLNATVFTSSRLFCMGAQERHLPSTFGMLHHDRCTPIPSLILSVILSLAMLFVTDIYSLIDYFSFTYWLWTGIAVASGVYLRHTRPELDRPIRLPLPFLYLFIAMCWMLTALAMENIFNTIVGVCLMIAGVIVYWIKLLYEHQYSNLEGKNAKQWNRIDSFVQKLFLIVETVISTDV